MTENGTVEVSTGVVFKIIDVPPFAFNTVKKNMAAERPRVPTVYLEEKGREEQNPNHPDYIAAMEEYDLNLTERLVDMMLTLGTEVVSTPDDFPQASENGWTEKLKLLEIDIPTEEHPRYLLWVKFCAARAGDDLQSLIMACGRKAGVTEEDAAEAAVSFRDSEER